MKDEQLLKKCHKGECICDGCERRFVCWTTKRVFSNPTHQALYEAYIAEGNSHEEALQAVHDTLETAIREAAIREAMKQAEWDKYDKDIYKKKKDWHDEWYDNTFKPTISPAKNQEYWDKQWKQIGLYEAKKSIKDLEKYFRSMIHGKSTKR